MAKIVRMFTPVEGQQVVAHFQSTALGQFSIQGHVERAQLSDDLVIALARPIPAQADDAHCNFLRIWGGESAFELRPVACIITNHRDRITIPPPFPANPVRQCQDYRLPRSMDVTLKALNMPPSVLDNRLSRAGALSAVWGDAKIPWRAAKTINISGSGLQIAAMDSFSEGQHLAVRLMLGEEMIQAVARVQWSRNAERPSERSRAGLAFVGLGRAEEAKILRVVFEGQRQLLW